MNVHIYRNKTTTNQTNHMKSRICALFMRFRKAKTMMWPSHKNVCAQWLKNDRKYQTKIEHIKLSHNLRAIYAGKER